jgi:hypothetical protein
MTDTAKELLELTEREREILLAEIRGSAAEFLGWLTGLTPPADKEAIPPELRPAFDKMCNRLADAVEVRLSARQQASVEEVARTLSPDAFVVTRPKHPLTFERQEVAKSKARALLVKYDMTKKVEG